MFVYVAKRLSQAAAALLIVSVLTFVLTHMVGDPVAQYVGLGATQEQYDLARHLLGYDRPLYVQFGDFLRSVVTLDLGSSSQYGVPALGLVLDRLAVTGSLAVIAMIVALLIGVPLALMAGYKPNSLWDRAAVVVATIGVAVPGFVIAMLLILTFSVQLRWLPSVGWGTFEAAVLPVTSLAIFAMSIMVRITRSATRETMSKPFILLGRAKGLAEPKVVSAHALRQVLIPLITVGGLQLGHLLTGAVIIENVYSVPGLGTLVVSAVHERDYSVLSAAILVGAVLFVIINMLTDLCYGFIDPRIRAGQKA